MIICNISYTFYLTTFYQVDKNVIWVQNSIPHIKILKSIEGLDEEGAKKNIRVKREEKKIGVLTFNAKFHNLRCLPMQQAPYQEGQGEQDT